MPKTEKQRRAACARASGAKGIMQGMSKKKAAEWCHSPLDKAKKRKKR